MALLLNDEQRLLADSARGFFAEQAPVAALRALRDTADVDGFSRALWQRCAEMGFAGVRVPEAHGGMGLGLTEAAVLCESAGRKLAATPLLSTAVLGAQLLAAAPAALAAAWLPRIAAGQAVVALALDEGAKHRPDRIAATARADGGGWVLDGDKVLVLDGHVAQLLVVVARTAGGIGLFAVEAGSAGLSVQRTVMVDAHNAARVRLAGVRVGADARIGSDADGAALLEAALDAGRVCVAAELLGAGDEAFARTMAYLKERRQFGRLIGEFQALQHRAAELYGDLELARAALARAAEALDGGRSGAAALVAVAKAKACQAADRAVREAVQMHGGIGMTDVLDMGFFMKRVRVLQELLGDASFHESRLAVLHGY
ncbi:MAG: acyl-CoA dehydrogenase family protein [Aquabacterium sp.]